MHDHTVSTLVFVGAIPEFCTNTEIQPHNDAETHSWIHRNNYVHRVSLRIVSPSKDILKGLVLLEPVIVMTVSKKDTTCSGHPSQNPGKEEGTF